MHGQVTFVVQFGIGPLFEAIAEDDDAATGGYLQVEFDMPVAEDIVVAMVADFLLLFGKEDEFFFVLAFVGAGVGYLIEAALFRPGIAEFVSPCRREAAEEELGGRRVKEFLEADEGPDLFLHGSGVECLPIGRQQSVAMAEVYLLAIAADGAGLIVHLHTRQFGQSAEGPEVIEAINAELRFMEDEGIIDDVYTQAIVSQFGTIRIPVWVWFLLVFLTFLFLVVFSINRYLLSKRLQIANARAEESTRMKGEFIKQISHEIRTPLNILSGFTQILTSPKALLSEEERANASLQIMQSTDRITKLVNKMLELSDANSLVVLDRNDTVTPLSIAVEAITETGIAEMLHLTFTLKKGAGAEQPFTTNFRSAVRILEQQLDNAIKFTQPAEAHIKQAEQHEKESVTLTIEETDNSVRFIIENTGLTIPVKDAERIFDEFVQLDEYYNGTGIGLTVARSLARRLGGDIVLDTTYTEGVRFVTTLER